MRIVVTVGRDGYRIRIPLGDTYTAIFEIVYNHYDELKKILTEKTRLCQMFSYPMGDFRKSLMEMTIHGIGVVPNFNWDIRSGVTVEGVVMTVKNVNTGVESRSNAIPWEVFDKLGNPAEVYELGE